MEENKTIIEEVQGTTKFGLGQIGNHTPETATWIFRIIFYVLTLSTIALNTLNVSRLGLSPEDLKDLNALIAFIVMASHGLTKMFGVQIEPTQDYVDK